VLILAEKDKITIKNFKDSSSNWWVNQAHYYLNEDGKIIWCAGETDKIELRNYLIDFIKRNKKVFTPRELNIFETEEKEYSTVTFGKMSGKTTQIIVAEDKKYARWLYENTADKNIKEELKELLKIK